MNFTQRAFIVNKQLQGLLLVHDIDAQNANSDKSDRQRVSMQSIVDAILTPNSQKSKALLLKINGSLSDFRRYKQVLATLSLMQSQSQIAASSLPGAASKIFNYTRKGNGFEIKLIQESEAITSDVYIVLTLENTSESQDQSLMYLHCELAQQIQVISLSKTNPTKYQGIVKAKDVIVSTIVNDESHLYLTSA